ncbi:WecB/TagA/CpsF family glycosyltransferase [Candidatus Uhrbacteria bacterium]|nr:WecB/TagA/CpsF family glycosyltransferase [Candidatus Uhrbacteria bacterium]
MPSRSTCSIFGLVISGIGMNDIVGRIADAERREERMWIVTANPEILLEAKRNPRYWETLRCADLRIVDGVGLQFVGWLFHSSLRRVSGVDLAEHLAGMAERRGWKIALLGGSDGVADRAAWALRKRYPGLRVVAEQGGTVDAAGEGDRASDEAFARLISERPDILLVGFGHPKQEAWIARHAESFPALKVVVGVGGTFDYWADRSHRAPRGIRMIGLEWLWRLGLEPRRFPRIIRAVILFPIRAVFDRRHTPSRL